MSEKNLAGRKALVTGGARGIGAAIAEALANEGASVIINGRTQKRVDAAIAKAASPRLSLWREKTKSRR